LERERNMQYALEEQRQVSNLLREQLTREKDETEVAHQTIAQRDDQISECRTQAERDKEKQRRLEADLHDQHKNVVQLRDNLTEQNRRLRQREEDIENLEVALNDLKENMIKEIEYKNRDLD